MAKIVNITITLDDGAVITENHDTNFWIETRPNSMNPLIHDSKVISPLKEFEQAFLAPELKEPSSSTIPTGKFDVVIDNKVFGTAIAVDISGPLVTYYGFIPSELLGMEDDMDYIDDIKHGEDFKYNVDSKIVSCVNSANIVLRRPINDFTFKTEEPKPESKSDRLLVTFEDGQKFYASRGNVFQARHNGIGWVEAPHVKPGDFIMVGGEVKQIVKVEPSSPNTDTPLDSSLDALEDLKYLEEISANEDNRLEVTILGKYMGTAREKSWDESTNTLIYYDFIPNKSFGWKKGTNTRLHFDIDEGEIHYYDQDMNEREHVILEFIKAKDQC